MHCELSLIPLGFVFAWCALTVKMEWEVLVLGGSIPMSLSSQPDWQPHWCRRCLLGFLQGSFHQHEALGHLPLLMATVGTGARLRAGLWDPHSNCCRLAGQVNPSGDPALAPAGGCVRRQHMELPSSEDTLWSSPSPLLGITNLLGKWIVSKGLALNPEGFYGGCHLLPSSQSPGTWPGCRERQQNPRTWEQMWETPSLDADLASNLCFPISALLTPSFDAFLQSRRNLIP